MSETFEKQAQLYAAFARAQGNFPAIPRNRTVTVKTKTGGSYKFDYAPLETILDHVRKPLAEEGLAVSQALVSEGGETFLATALLHENGGELSSRLALAQAKSLPPQELGSLLTYMRRYSLQALLGIATEEDDDANTAQGNTVTAKKDRKIAGENEAAPSPEPVPGFALPPQGPARSPATSDDARKALLAERWNKLSAAEAKAKLEEIALPVLLRELLIVESDRPSPRKGVLTAISKRISVLEGEPPAENVAQPVSGEAASPSEQLLRLQAALAFIAEQPASVEDPEAWTVRGVLAGLMANGGGVYSTLEQVPGEWLERVWGALPEGVQQFAESLGPEALAEMAGKAK